MNDSLPSGRLARLVALLLVAAFPLCVDGRFAVAQPAATDVSAAQTRLEALGKDAKHKIDSEGRLTEIAIEDGAELTADDVALFGRLGDLRSLKILNCRVLNDEMVEQLAGLKTLDTLALTNSALTDAGVEKIVQSFPNLVELDLSSNTNMTGAAMKLIAGLGKLERLTLLQNRFNDLQVVEPVLQEREPFELAKTGDQLHRRARHVGIRRQVEFDEVRKRLHDLLDARIREGAVGERQRIEGLEAGELLHHLIVEDAAVENLERPQIAEPAEERHVVGREFRTVLDCDLRQAAFAVDFVLGILAEGFEPCLCRGNVGGRRLRDREAAVHAEREGCYQKQRHQPSQPAAWQRIVHVSLVEEVRGQAPFAAQNEPVPIALTVLRPMVP